MNEIHKSKPTETGYLLVRCAENDYEWRTVIISNSNTGLKVHRHYLPPISLDYYHEMLTNIEWRRPEINIQTDWIAA